MEQSSSAFSCSFASHERRRSTIRTAVSLSRVQTSAGVKPQRPARRGRTCGVTSDGKSGGLGDNLSVRKVKAHTTLDAVLAGVISADDRAGNELADAACKLVVLEHHAPQPSVRWRGGLF